MATKRSANTANPPNAPKKIGSVDLPCEAVCSMAGDVAVANVALADNDGVESESLGDPRLDGVFEVGDDIVVVGVSDVVDAMEVVDTGIALVTMVVIELVKLAEETTVAVASAGVKLEVQFFERTMTSLPFGNRVGVRIKVQISVVFPSGEVNVCDVLIV